MQFIARLARFTGVATLTCVGGADVREEIRTLQAGVQVEKLGSFELLRGRQFVATDLRKLRT